VGLGGWVGVGGRAGGEREGTERRVVCNGLNWERNLPEGVVREGGRLRGGTRSL